MGQNYMNIWLGSNLVMSKDLGEFRELVVGWWIYEQKSWEDCQKSHLSEVGGSNSLYLINNHGKEVFWQIGHSILVALSCGPRPVLSPSQLSTLLLKWYLSASRCTRQLRRAIKSCSGFCIHVTVDKISAAPQQLLQPQQSDSWIFETWLKRQKGKLTQGNSFNKQLDHCGNSRLAHTASVLSLKLPFLWNKDDRDAPEHPNKPNK